MNYVFLTSFGISFLNPWIAIATLSIGSFIWTFITKRSYANPVFLISFLGGFYYLSGGLNISTYRGEVTENTMFLSFIFLFLIVLGGSAAQLGRTKVQHYSYLVERDFIVLAFIPGTIGLLLMAPSGFPLFNPNAFTNVSGKAYFLAEFLVVPFLLLFSNAVFHDFRRVDLLMLSGALFLLSLSGYRGWPMIAIMISVICYMDIHREKAFRYAFMSSLALFLILSGLSYFRRINNFDLIPAEDLLSSVGAESLGIFVGLMHLAFRESIAIGQVLIDYSDALSVYKYESLFFSDLLTMLPGKTYESGGVIVASMFAVDRGVGLTPGALGALIFDFGIFISMFFAFCLGFFLGRVYLKSVGDNGNLWLLLYLLLTIYILHYMHRGIPKPGYFFIPMFLYLIIKFKNIYYQKSTK